MLYSSKLLHYRYDVVSCICLPRPQMVKESQQFDDGTADEIVMPDGTRLGKVRARFTGSPRHVAMGLAPALGVPGFMREVLSRPQTDDDGNESDERPSEE